MKNQKSLLYERVINECSFIPEKIKYFLLAIPNLPIPSHKKQIFSFQRAGPGNGYSSAAIIPLALGHIITHLAKISMIFSRAKIPYSAASPQADHARDNISMTFPEQKERSHDQKQNAQQQTWRSISRNLLETARLFIGRRTLLISGSKILTGW